MKDRFEGEHGRRVLVDVLKEQKIVGGNEALAEEMAAVGELREIVPDTPIIDQNGQDTDCFLILAGSFTILVNGKKVAMRGPTDCVGEMAAIQPSQRRSATVVAAEPSVVLKLTEPQLSALGQKYPNIYRAIAKELARRLMQRNLLITTRREKIRVFIISSVEALPIARGVQNAFEYDPFTVVIWTDGVFRASCYPVESLERELDQSDFAIAIAQPDDLTESRGEAKPTPRDNVIFELGFFMGRLGRHRSLLLEPRGEEVKLPSDLSGITAIAYKYDPKDLPAAMGPACNRIRDIINDLGPNN
ncbi:MAG TPA: TIR domain-containing protein [Vicinamibacterales bacterium]|nr:TIR domain-containing protein [Vicinamibacterales bacterium]